MCAESRQSVCERERVCVCVCVCVCAYSAYIGHRLHRQKATRPGVTRCDLAVDAVAGSIVRWAISAEWRRQDGPDSYSRK